MSSGADPRNLQDLQQFTVPGANVEDLLYYDESSDEDAVYDVVRGKGDARHARVVQMNATGANTQNSATSAAKMQPSQHNTRSSVLKKIRVDDFHEGGGGASGGTRANQRVLDELRDVTMNGRSGGGQTNKDVDRSERATVENVMDPRTRLILYKLVNSGIIKEVNGCVSTGKEANVYYAVYGDGSDVAIKVFKTSILVFRDREQYVAGEFRFQRYCKGNPRKMVRTWAEKEARNLNRLQDGGVLAPAVKLLRQHVLVMEFLGENGWPSPRLKEVRFPNATAMDHCYLDLCCTMRKMYGRCRLVHGDLSEYNLLLFRGRVVVIDVSQSVEHDHPRATDFLRRDIVNVNAFFRSQGHRQLFSLKDLYMFITAPLDGAGWQRCSGPDNTDELMARLLQVRTERDEEGQEQLDAEQAKIDEQVFMHINVPRSLGEIADYKAPNREVVGFVENMLADAASEDDDEDDSDEEFDEEDDDFDDEEGSGEEDGSGEVEGTNAGRAHQRAVDLPKTLREMDKDERKDHKKTVKDANRLRREEKAKKKNAGKKTKKKK